MTVGQLIAILMKQPRSLNVMIGGASKSETTFNIVLDIRAVGGYTIRQNDRLANFADSEERQPGADDLVFMLWP